MCKSLPPSLSQFHWLFYQTPPLLSPSSPPLLSSFTSIGELACSFYRIHINLLTRPPESRGCVTAQELWQRLRFGCVAELLSPSLPSFFKLRPLSVCVCRSPGVGDTSCRHLISSFIHFFGGNKGAMYANLTNA